MAAPAAANCAHSHALPKQITTKQADAAVACLLNKQRKAHGLGKLRINHDLDKASRKHSEYMEKHDCFDHECPGEASVESRLRSVQYLISGLTSWIYGENIAWGGDKLGTPKAMVKAWMSSAPHRANILDGSFRDLGVGVVWGSPGNPHDDAGLYTTDFGYRR
jgi:uncharacterized protein YkwD